MNRNDFRFGALLVYFVDLCRVTAANASREHREHPWPEANGFSRLGYITLQEHNLHLYANYNYTFTIYITNWNDLAAAFTCPKDQFRRMRRKAVSILAFACNLMMRIPPLSRRQWQCGCRSHWPLLKDSFPTEPIGCDHLWQIHAHKSVSKSSNVTCHCTELFVLTTWMPVWIPESLSLATLVGSWGLHFGKRWQDEA